MSKRKEDQKAIAEELRALGYFSEDPLERLGVTSGTSIYKIKAKTGGAIPFLPTPGQIEIYRGVYEFGWEFIIYIKSRQLGVSTGIDVLIADAMLFGSGIDCSIVDATKDDAKKKLSEKVKYTFSNFPTHITDRFEIIKDNDGEFSFKRKNAKDEDKCMCTASVSPRGGTINILHLSEGGTIQMDEPMKAEEILTGALPAAEHAGCVIFFETTWKGGRSGVFWPLMAEALRQAKLPEADKTAKTPRLLFSGWHTDPANRIDGNPALITADTHEYCDKAERILGKRLDNQQRLWWQETKKKQGIFMSREHPTMVDECFESPHEGAVFDAAGIKWQESQSIALEPRWKAVEIALQGEAPAEFAVWLPAANPRLCPFLMLEPPIDGESYILPADFCGRRMSAGAEGKRDTNAYGVWKAGKIDGNGRKTLPQLVCSCKGEEQTATEETMRRIKCMALLYGNCMVVPETNNKDDIAERLEALNLRIWAQGVTGADGAEAGKGKTTRVLGWHTSGDRITGGSRKRIIDHLEKAILEQEFIAGLPWIVHQLSVFIVDKDGKLQAAAGERDDWVLSTAIGLFTMGSATVYKDPKLTAVAAKKGYYNGGKAYDSRD